MKTNISTLSGLSLFLFSSRTFATALKSLSLSTELQGALRYWVATAAIEGNWLAYSFQYLKWVAFLRGVFFWEIGLHLSFCWCGTHRPSLWLPLLKDFLKGDVHAATCFMMWCLAHWLCCSLINFIIPPDRRHTRAFRFKLLPCSTLRVLCRILQPARLCTP